jgi:homoserine kinase
MAGSRVPSPARERSDGLGAGPRRELASGGGQRGPSGGPATVEVRVPATSANLGPAFDCAGLALTCHDVLEFGVRDSGLEVVVTGEGADGLPTDESHLVVRAFRAACAELGWQPPGLSVVAHNAIPQGRGMGSSAAAVVAGVVGAWALCPDVDDIDRAAVLRLTTELEGHPDNVAPCLLGGATLSWMAADGARATRLEVDPSVVPVVLVPPGVLSTHVARGLLPDVVPHADAAANAGRAALLVHALTSDPALLLDATEDRLHQRQRGAAMPESLALIDRLRAGGHAAVVSGAGPSVLVLGSRGAVPEVTGLTPEGWIGLALEVDEAGVGVLHGNPRVSSR